MAFIRRQSELKFYECDWSIQLSLLLYTFRQFEFWLFDDVDVHCVYT